MFSCIRTKYRGRRSISPYSVQMRENTDQNNSEYGLFSRSVSHSAIDEATPIQTIFCL